MSRPPFPAAALQKLRDDEDKRLQDQQAAERALRDAHRSLCRAEAVLQRLCAAVAPTALVLPLATGAAAAEDQHCLDGRHAVGQDGDDGGRVMPEGASLTQLAEGIAAQGDAVTRCAHDVAERMAVAGMADRQA